MASTIVVNANSRISDILELLVKMEDSETIADVYKYGSEAAQEVKDFILIHLGQVAGRDLNSILGGLHDARVIAEGGV